jgi:hypothetical protein
MGGQPAVRDAFLACGGGEGDWSWIVRELEESMPGRQIERDCVKLALTPPCHRMVHGPVVVWGYLDLFEETLWDAGVVDGLLLVEAVVPREYEREFFAERSRQIPEEDQNL